MYGMSPVLTKVLQQSPKFFTSYAPSLYEKNYILNWGDFIGYLRISGNGLISIAAVGLFFHHWKLVWGEGRIALRESRLPIGLVPIFRVIESACSSRLETRSLIIISRLLPFIQHHLQKSRVRSMSDRITNTDDPALLPVDHGSTCTFHFVLVFDQCFDISSFDEFRHFFN